MRQIFLQNATAILLRNATKNYYTIQNGSGFVLRNGIAITNFITKYDSY